MYRKYYFLTDGESRLLAFTDTAGTDQTQGSIYTTLGGADAGAISKAQTFDNSRAEAAAAPHLSYYRNRYYDQATGRWTQEDPIGVAGGLNLYAYVGNNPAAYTDPFGLCDDPNRPECRDQAQAIIGAVTSFFASLPGKAIALGARAIASLGKAIDAVIPGVGEASAAASGVNQNGRRLNSSQRALALGIAAGEGAAAAGPEILFKSAHGARHAVEAGLSPDVVEAAIRKQVSEDVTRASLTGGGFGGRVSVGGQIIEYRAHTLESGAINIGTYYEPKLP